LSKLIIIDNYDSFTYNLVHYLEPYCKEITVFRNDDINYQKISKSHKILLSPGPGLPKENKELINVIDRFHLTNNILGICLGYQALGEYFGAKLYNLPLVRHGIQTKLQVLDHEQLFKNLPSNFLIGHYHSWIIKEIPKLLKICAIDYEKNAMAFRHLYLNIYGIQFHPESILTEHGQEILKNWINS
jgi:anthranilate synthase component 2